MRYRRFGRTGWQVSEIGYGMWGMGGWTGSDDEESLRALDRAFALGCNFFDTAWAYGDGQSETAARRGAARATRRAGCIVATKIPPKNMQVAGQGRVPGRRHLSPPITSASTPRRASQNLGVRAIDLQQFHVWSDAWADDEGWQRAVDDLKREKLVRAFGISVNRWEPANVLRALETGLDRQRAGGLQHLRPGAGGRAVPVLPGARHRGHRARAVRRRQPDRHADARLDVARGRLAEPLLHAATTSTATLERVDRLDAAGARGHGPAGAGAALHPRSTRRSARRFPGMRRPAHVERNLAASDGEPLPPRLVEALGAHRWDRASTVRSAACRTCEVAA